MCSIDSIDLWIIITAASVFLKDKCLTIFAQESAAPLKHSGALS